MTAGRLGTVSVTMMSSLPAISWIVPPWLRDFREDAREAIVARRLDLDAAAARRRRP